MEEHLLIEDIYPGLSWRHTRKVEDGEVRASVEFARDFGGYHVDESFARAAGFRGLITSGCYQVALVAELGGQVNLLGRELSLRYTAPIYEGDTLESVAEVVAVERETREVTLQIRVSNQDGVEVLTGRLTGYLPAPEWGTPARPQG